MKNRQIILQEQPHGGYRLVIEGETVGAPGFGDAVMDQAQAVTAAVKVAAQLDGPTEIYSQPRAVYMRTAHGKAVPLQVGDRVQKMLGDVTLFGDVVQAENEQDIPRVDDDGNPVLVVHADDGEITSDLEGWTYTPRSGR